MFERFMINKAGETFSVKITNLCQKSVMIVFSKHLSQLVVRSNSVTNWCCITISLPTGPYSMLYPLNRCGRYHHGWLVLIDYEVTITKDHFSSDVLDFDANHNVLQDRIQVPWIEHLPVQIMYMMYGKSYADLRTGHNSRVRCDSSSGISYPGLPTT